jgi:hypothetical protein
MMPDTAAALFQPCPGAPGDRKPPPDLAPIILVFAKFAID